MKIKHALVLFVIVVIATAFFLHSSFFSVLNDKSLSLDSNSVNTIDQVVQIAPPVIIVDYYEPDIVLNKLQVPDSIVTQMALVDVQYLGFDSLLHQGQIIVHHSIAEEVSLIFKELLIANFPIEKVVPVVYYNWDDDSSMRDNNTSSFNYRRVKNSSNLSSHALGLAIDINPMLNPYIDRFGKTSPANGVYNISERGTITDTTQCFKIFRKYGWKWGGHWRYSKDYQHFSKNGK